MAIITKDELEDRYYNTKNSELAKELNISVPTLLKLIDVAEIKRKGSGNAYYRDSLRVVK